ncbi:hypothetical protein [Flavobacterium gawalongense]|uniref:Uncharacterized protein n=1 Tax=Flavobacterium gawalongense TaxID=2594432 RepID=A0A553BI64_9FLAO|nr:hypothetical protein [Flavobacterium gawalongense]TRX00202.1 hypothetical protein FNW33_12915 [Flavobacterium gawalongense]TRX04960.1 hypothetical protein FNW12_12390 [Flavobacterium gawalongense]TRX07946.1 hypothetical protein FNW11_11990 [Flavobacterium gawalongense]TRX08647.1 hypothetical protein FNW10_12505 [Flavobacterium gawalongense]TRX24573.1 hypothetical protein FNW38_13125 [Flavobacterium gawalongense]
MNRILILLIIALLISCKNNKTQNYAITSKIPLSAKPTEEIATEPTIEDKLKRHFELYRIKPSIIINRRQ